MEAVYNTDMDMFGRKTSKTADWFEAHAVDLRLVMEEKRNTLATYKISLSERILQVLQASNRMLTVAAQHH